MSDDRRPQKNSAGLLAGACVWLILASISNAQQSPLKRFEFSRIEMGVDFRVALYASDSEVASNAASAAFDRVHDLNNVMSDYESSSELMRLCATSKPGKPVVVSPELMIVLSHSQLVATASNGAFDVTLGPVTKLWRRARRQMELPAADDLQQARASVGFQFLRLSPQDRSVELLKPEMRLDLGGIAKGYAADEALKILRAKGISRALVAASGDIAVGDPPPGKVGWIVEVESLTRKNVPDLSLKLANQAVSTSGDAYQSVEIAGRRYSHIVDPKTGLGLEQRSSVTIIAATGMQADALATAVTVLGPEAGLELVRSGKAGQAEALCVRLDEHNRPVRHATAKFATFVVDGAATEK